jgi:hypothetical protein
MKRVSLNQLMKLKLPSIGLPAIIKPQPTALIPYVKKTGPPHFDMPVPDALAIAALEEYEEKKLTKLPTTS